MRRVWGFQVLELAVDAISVPLHMDMESTVCGVSVNVYQENPVAI